MPRQGAQMPPVRVLQRWLWEMEQYKLFRIVKHRKYTWTIEAQDKDFDCFTVYLNGNRIGEIFVTNWQIDFISYDDDEDFEEMF